MQAVSGVLPLLFSLFQGPQDDSARVRELFERLSSSDVAVREAASTELLSLPTSAVPTLLEKAKEARDPELRNRITQSLVSLPWAKVLHTTIGQARDAVQTLSGLKQGYRDGLVRQLMSGFMREKEEYVQAVLSECLESSLPELKEFALRGHALFVARDPAPIVKLLNHETLGRQAADALIRANDASLIGSVIDVFASDHPRVSESGRVLAALGAGEHVARVAALVRGDPKRQPWGIAALWKTGGPNAEKALIEMVRADGNLNVYAASALSYFRSERAKAVVLEFIRQARPEEILGRRLGVLRDRLIAAKGDRDWIKEKLLELLLEPGKSGSGIEARTDRLAALGGSALREEVLQRLKEPGVKIGIQNRLLPILGVVGKSEDIGLLLEKTKDPRLMEAAGQALDRIKDPRTARPIMAEFKRYTLGLSFGMSLLDLPATELESDLVEIFSDPRGYNLQTYVSLRLAEKNPTQKVRSAILAGLGEDEGWWGSSRAWGTRILARTARPEDDPEITKMRAHKKVDIRASGLILAMHRGDEKAAQELCRLMSEKKLFTVKYGDERDPILDWIAPPGDAWPRAVLKEWKRNPAWTQGALWLALRGNEDALTYLRKNLEELDKRNHLPIALRALAARGDKDAQIAMLDRLGSRRDYQVGPRERAVLVAHALPEIRHEILIRARFSKARNNLDDPFLRLLALMREPRATDLFRATVRSGNVSLGAPIVVDCASALAHLAPEGAAGDLRVLLHSSSPNGRAAALEALAALKEPDTVREAIWLVDDPQELRREPSRSGLSGWVARKRVWHVAMEVLERVTGVKGEGSSILGRRRFWREWYEKNK